MTSRYNEGYGRVGRKSRGQQAQNQHRLILFAYHLGNGAEPIQAYMSAGLWERNHSDADYGSDLPPRQDEIDDKVEEAETLAETSLVKNLIGLTKADPRKLLQSGLSMAVLKLMSLAFTATSERVQLVAVKEWMSRGGLPAETKLLGVGQTQGELEKLTDDELYGKLRDLFSSWEGAKRMELEGPSDG